MLGLSFSANCAAAQYPARESISHPSTFEPEVSCLVFALKVSQITTRLLSHALAAYSALLQRALSQPACLFILDECPILFEFDAISHCCPALY